MRTGVMILSILLSSISACLSVLLHWRFLMKDAQQKNGRRGMAGSAAVSVSAKEGLIHTDEIPDLLSIDAKAGILKGSALYHENGYYETIDLAAAELSELKKINPPRLADGKDISDFSGSRIILTGPIHLKIRHSKRRCQ